MAAHVERHGENSPIKVISLPEKPDELLNVLADQVRYDNKPVMELVEQIRTGRVPLGMLSTALGRGYAFALVKRELGMYISSALIDDDLDADLDAASAAIGSDVVVEASALLVSALLKQFSTVRGQFPRLLLPLDSKLDIRRARTEMNGVTSSSGLLGWRSDASGLAYSEPDFDHQLASLRRLQVLEDASSHTVTSLFSRRMSLIS